MGGNGKSGETPRGKAVRRMVLGIDERINGVNLGNWLVLEKWMDPEPFVRTDEDDEIWMHRTHGALWSERNLAEELRRHRDAYITLEDFRIIADHGLNLVRIPIPYFIFGDWPGHPGCIAYLDRAFRWARETGLKIMIDLHTVPGSQNGFDNGGLTGVCKWAQNPDLVEYALNVLERLARRYRDEPTLHSIEVLNEPVSWSVFHGTSNTAKDVREASGSTHVPLRFLKRFYRDAYARLRAILRPETIIVFHDGFRLLRWGDWFRRAGMRNVMLDTHQYLIAMEEPLFAGPARRLYLQSGCTECWWVRAKSPSVRRPAISLYLWASGAWRTGGPCTAGTERTHTVKYRDCNARHGMRRRGRSIGATSLRVPRNQAAAKENRHVTRATAAISKHGT